VLAGTPIIVAALRIKFDMISQEGNGTGRTKDTKQFTKLLDETIERTASLSYELQPPVLSEFGLRAAIEWLGNKFLNEYNVRFDYKVEGTPVDIDTRDAALLYRIGRELMFNVIKHAYIDSARVTLRWYDEAVSLEVEDEGAGYDPSIAASTGEGLRFGLASVRERVTALGGSYDVDTQPGDGTRVTLNIPLPGRATRLAGVMA
jgi:signal transduction histidine kinase